MTASRAVSWWPWALAVGFLLLAPLLVSDFFLGQILGRALWLGIAAASLIFLAGYGGMVSLAQTALYGVAGFTMANLVMADGGLAQEWPAWAGVAAGVAMATTVGLIFGAVSSRSEGIYFLMITLAFAVITYFFFGQVTQLSGFGGVNQVDRPDGVGHPFSAPAQLYYTTLIGAVLVYLFLRYVVVTPFGVALQGVRDDPVRMRALGFNVPLHRTLAFGVGAFVAAIAGILSVWWNTRISPGSVDLTRTLDVLVIAVVGGLVRLEGAWIGAIVFTLLDNYTRDLTGQRFNTVIGAVFLAVVLLSPNGLIGIWQSVRSRVPVRGRLRPPAGQAPSALSPLETPPTQGGSG
jgi:branched-chain amino acid transport system permease protein